MENTTFFFLPEDFFGVEKIQPDTAPDDAETVPRVSMLPLPALRVTFFSFRSVRTSYLLMSTKSVFVSKSQQYCTSYAQANFPVRRRAKGRHLFCRRSSPVRVVLGYGACTGSVVLSAINSSMSIGFKHVAKIDWRQS